ncbi:Uncharacterised protein [Xylophilus ampelinus]|nr:Uncharacterised protein [Xylophilus ampelinus]
MVTCLAGAYATAGQDDWQRLHETLGETMAGLVVFRIAWGFAGSHHARFSSFVKGPRAVMRCLRDLPRGWAKRHLGHSPAGAVLIIAMILLALLAAASGWASERSPTIPWLRGLHGGSAHAMLTVASLYIVAVLAGNWRAGEKLLRPMISGTKWGVAGEEIRSGYRGIAWLVLAAVLGFWWYQW